ncbi:MAG: protein arginine kinase [Candidatus Omnitrophota bacterium]
MMEIDDLISRKCEWIGGKGPKAGIAISTRVRLARNIEGHVYFSRADKAGRGKTMDTVIAAAKRMMFFKPAVKIMMADTSDLDRGFLMERHLISREMMEDTWGRALILSDNDVLSAMVNEEDHMRFQVIKSGFDIMEAWRIVDSVDTEMSKYLPMDFSNRFGYLTSCPTNTGTGLRVSVMLHLSALVMTGQIENLFSAISKLGFTMRGFYGEGTQALGDFFQISNQVSLGHSETDILDSLERIIGRIIAQEEKTRANLMSDRKKNINARIGKSYETLKNAEIITANETVKLLSAVRLGADMGLIKDVTIQDVNEALLFSQPAHMEKMSAARGASEEIDIKRADLLREKFGKK